MDELVDVLIPDIGSEHRITGIASDSFPTPPSSFGWLGDVNFDITLYGLEAPYILTNAVAPESTHLEPTLGQIWPRIG